MITTKTLNRSLLLSCILGLPSIGLANPEKTDQLIIQTSTPKRAIETSFSSMVSWQKVGINFNKANGLAFIKGTHAKKPLTSIEVSKKVAGALSAAIKTEAPSDRGATTEVNQDKPEFLIFNKAGFTIDRITTRDYTNQALSYCIPEKSFPQLQSIFLSILFILLRLSMLEILPLI